MRSARLLVALGLLAAVGCDTADPVVTASVDPVIPLEVGGEWVLAQAYGVSFDEAGAVRDTIRQEPGRLDTLAVTRDTVVAGERWFRIEASRPFQHCVFDGAGWFANRPDGLYRWTTRPDSAEIVYASGVEPGEPFIETPVVVATLDAERATYDLPRGPVTAAKYGRTWRRIEVNDEIQGPISPTAHSTDYLSSTEGLVALEISYVRFGPGSRDTFVPVGTTAYELVSYTVRERPSLAGRGGAAQAAPGRFPAAGR